MILRRVRVSGFRSVKRDIEFVVDPKITVLLGANDHGKTNLLLAIWHLHPDRPFAVDDRNWDLGASQTARIVYQLELTAEDRSMILRDWRAAQEASAPEKPSLSLVPEFVEIERDSSALLHFVGPAFPSVLEPLVLARVPKVELIRPIESIPDSATAAEIILPDFEFMQGIFLYAGIKREEWSGIFTQTPATQKRLTTASTALTRRLRKDWSAGRDLSFQLRHDSATSRIDLHIIDPSVSKTWVRASQRSDGFTHYFGLRTRLYARTGGRPGGSYIWLFDEPGVWLHPSGQFDLMQALEALASANQVVYTTHSIFLINRNFPTRHRLVSKSREGTKLDSKPFAGKWQAALDALGFSISGALLFAPCVLLAEGDADAVILYPLLQRLAADGLWDGDLNSLAIMATGDERNAEAVARLLLQGAQPPRIGLLVDGDVGGRGRVKGMQQLIDQGLVQLVQLPDGHETEDYVPEPALYLAATAFVAAELTGTQEEDLADKLSDRYEEWLKEADGGQLLGKWAGRAAKDVAKLPETPSKVVVAREWAGRFSGSTVAATALGPILALAEEIARILALPKRETDERIL